jgi:hypothetical protein
MTVEEYLELEEDATPSLSRRGLKHDSNATTGEFFGAATPSPSRRGLKHIDDLRRHAQHLRCNTVSAPSFLAFGCFSAANLLRIKQFYETYAKDENLAPMVREISWTKNLVILEPCKESAERQFYIERTKQVRLDQKRPDPPD